MKELAHSLYNSSYLTGEFVLRSGETSQQYFDKYQFEANPILLNQIALELVKLIPTETELLAGLEMGGIPVVTMLSHHSGIPCVFVRKTAKKYGTAKLAEGPQFEGKRVTIVEDVVSSAGQIALSAEDLRSRGAIVTDAICVIDRQSGGADALSRSGLSLIALFKMDQLLPTE